MSKELITVNPQLPAIFQNADTSAFDDFTDGIVAGFPVISYRGRTWRVKKGGEEQVYLNDAQEAVQSIEVVLLKSNPNLGKIYYKKKYEEGDNQPPACWSADGVRPDQGVQDKQCATCAACPHNVWGSRITDNGKKTKACQDHRRMAVVFKHDVEEAASNPKHEPTPLLLRVPPASLTPLKEFIEKVLKPKGVLPYAVFCRIGFDTTVSHPQLTFKGVQFLNQEQGQVVVDLRNSDEVKRILSEAEYSSEGTPEADEAAAAATGAANAEAASAPSESKKSKSKAKLQPAQEEELHSGAPDDGDEIAAPAPTTVESTAEEIAPPAPQAATAPQAAKEAEAAPAAAPEPTAPAAGEGESSFDDMLDSLLET